MKRIGIVDKVKLVEQTLKKLGYKSSEPFNPGDELILLEIPEVIYAKFKRYDTCPNKNSEECRGCFGLIIVSSDNPNINNKFFCLYGAWKGSIRRVIKKDDPIATPVLISVLY